MDTTIKAKPRPVVARLNLRWSIYTALVFAFFFIALMVTIGLAWETAEQQHSVYAGQAAFETPEGYAGFKILLAQPDVDIIAYREYSQTYPVLVSYDVTMLSSIEFPYSEAISTYGGGASAWRIGAAVTVLIALFIALIYGVLKTTRKIV
jgi:hypothetical protein